MNNKITIPISELKSSLLGLSKVTNKRAPLPVLGCVLFNRNNQGHLQLTGTNLDDYLTRTIGEALVPVNFEALIPLGPLSKLVNDCATISELTIESLKEEVRITYPITGATLTERIECPKLDEFPAIPDRVWLESVAVGTDFKTALIEALDSASEDESRFVLRSAFVDVSDPEAHYVVGTNGRELFSANSFRLDFKESLIVPNRKFLVWKGFLEDGDWTICLSEPKPPEKNKPAEPNWISVRSNGWTLVTKQIDGNYPNWRHVVPDQKQANSIVCFDQAARDFVIRAAPRLPGSDEQSKPITLHTQANSLILSANSRAGEANLPVASAVAEGKDTRITLNRDYLVKAMKLDCEFAELHRDANPIPVVVFRKDGKRLIVAGLRPDEPATIQTQPPAPAPSSSPAEEVEFNQQQPEEMKTANRIEEVQTATVSTAATAPVSAFEQVCQHIESIKAKLKGVVSDLNDTLKLLTQAQKERRASEKEIDEVRETLQSLQKIRI
jgi:DNA polymerase III sliding clamp (beta) subunit (PCNA family)